MQEGVMWGALQPKAEQVKDIQTREREKMLDDARLILNQPRAMRIDENACLRQHNLKGDMEQLRKDKMRVCEKERGFDKQEKDVISEAFEITLSDFIKITKFLGEANMQRASKFDDYFNGIDGAVEFKKPEDKLHRIALVMDATIGKSAQGADMHTVIEKVKHNIEKVLARSVKMRYFHSEIDGYKGPLENIIPVVIGVEGKMAQELISLNAEIIRLSNKQPKDVQDEIDLAYKLQAVQQHPAQTIILEEIRVQAEMYVDILQDLGGEYAIYLAEARKLLEIANELILKKTELKVPAYENDNVLKAIKEIAESKKEERE